MTNIGEAVVLQLKARGVKCIFGIPGVHTIELYRGLPASGIRHITPRHEQGAAFMADGYARVSGKPGVVFVISGPGLINAMTGMAQARSDSVPMLVVSGVNALPTLGQGFGYLHELPDQLGLSAKVSLVAERIESAADVTRALDMAYAQLLAGRPGPVHIELPMDVALRPGTDVPGGAPLPIPCQADQADIAEAADRLMSAKSPVILAGGGARGAADLLQLLAERLDAPVVQTVNARGIMHKHRLCVPACPSLEAVRELIGAADVVLAVGTEIGQTDYDAYESGRMAQMAGLIRIDICAEQLRRRPAALTLHSDAGSAVGALLGLIPEQLATGTGAARAEATCQKAIDEIGPEMRSICQFLTIARDTVPGAIMVGDSTQPVYAGNLYYDHDRVGGWFNSSVGFGTLGYGIPAAIGAAIAAPDAPVICWTGDGGAQFSLPELMCAVDEGVNVTFVVWNNHGYEEIARSMRAVGSAVFSCTPTPPHFEALAKAFGMPFRGCPLSPEKFSQTLEDCSRMKGPKMIEIRV